MNLRCVRGLSDSAVTCNGYVGIAEINRRGEHIRETEYLVLVGFVGLLKVSQFPVKPYSNIVEHLRREDVRPFDAAILSVGRDGRAISRQARVWGQRIERVHRVTE